MIEKETPRHAHLLTAHARSIAFLFLALLSFAMLTPQLPAGSGLAGDLPLYFVENQGQLAREASYIVQGAEKTIYFTAEGMTVEVRKGGDDCVAPARWVFELEFLDACPNVVPKGVDRQAAVFNFFNGARDDWVTDVASYKGIVYRDLWPGIDLVFRAAEREIKYEFLVESGAETDRIRLAWRGASSVRVNDRGEMEVSSTIGGFTDAAPVAYQERDGERRAVQVSYSIGKAQPGDRVPWRFDIGDYDPTEELVIDPSMLLYCGYIGGYSGDDSYACAVGADGCLYVAGRCGPGADFPRLVGPDLTYNGGSSDAFIAKVSPSGESLLYCGFIGGTDLDSAHTVAVDDLGRAYVAGYTYSDDGSFPAVVGPFLTMNPRPDIFVARLSADGTSLEYCGFIGGNGPESSPNIKVDSAGHAYIAGTTASSEDTFPVKGGPDLTFNGQYGDAFVAKVSPTGEELIFCGYIGGDKIDRASGIDIDDQGGIYIVGGTYSTASTFPVVVGPDLTANGDYDGFVCRVVPSGKELDYCGYIGGVVYDTCTGVGVDSTGRLHVAGFTRSLGGTFPVQVGPDWTYNGDGDGFVARVTATGESLEYCGYIGGSGEDWIYEAGLDDDENFYVAGTTASDSGFPVLVGPDLSHNGDNDAFVARVAPTGAVLDFCGYIGGSEYEFFRGLTLDGNGNIYCSGSTGSSEDTLPVLVGPDTTFNSQATLFDALVCKLPPYHELLRSGFVRDAGGDPVDVLFVNNGAGPDAHRKMTISYNQIVQIRMEAPPLGPTPARFALYMVRREAAAADVSRHPEDMGTGCFVTPLTWTPPGPPTITLVNNIGDYSVYGTPKLPHVPPAPSIVFTGRLPQGTYTFQGLIEDTDTGVLHLTNAVVLELR